MAKRLAKVKDLLQQQEFTVSWEDEMKQTICFQGRGSFPSPAVMVPFIEVIKEAVNSNRGIYKTMAVHLASVLNPFLEQHAAEQSRNADCAISKGERVAR